MRVMGKAVFSLHMVEGCKVKYENVNYIIYWIHDDGASCRMCK